MDYLNTSETAKLWGISDRRVRILCREGRISGAILKGKTYFIPKGAQKPKDARFTADKIRLFLKWNNDVIGRIVDNYKVEFTNPKYNKVVEMYTKGADCWNRQEFANFLSDRLVHKDRKDIEKILFKLGFSKYDFFDLALTTRAINSSDMLWISVSENEKMEDAVSAVFSSIFGRVVDAEGDSVDSPEGYNVKRYGVYSGAYGIYKKRIHPFSYDVEAEVAVYRLGKLLGVDVCPAYKIDRDTVFSEFLYKIPDEHIVHFRHFFDFNRSDNEYENLLSVRPQYQADILKMMALDFITRQDDRHLSNIAIKISDDGESFYPLYDNGRSLFYEDTEETARKACEHPEQFSTAFGPVGTYLDHLKDAAKAGVDFKRLVNLNVKKQDIKKALKDAGYSEYRLDCAYQWICKAIDILKTL